MGYYFKKYIFMMGILVPILYFIHKSNLHADTIDLSVVSIVMFTLLSLGATFFVMRAAVKQQLFIGLTMSNTLLKMAASILILIVYKLQNDGLKPYFVLPFLVIYIAFTIFETSVMLHLANKKPS